MKKRISLAKVACLLLLTASIICGCDTPALVNPEDYNYVEFQDPTMNQEILAAYKKAGKVSRVFKSRAESARFFTGQIIDNLFGHTKVRFYGTLVEYDSLDESILSYVANLPQANALMHQGYDNVDYKADKTYVEFSTYTDVETDEIVAHEIRIFEGNFIDTFHTDFWYAKSVLFDPTMEIDLDRNVNIKTGEQLGGGSHNYWANGVFKSTDDYPDVLDKLGKITQVYAKFDSDDNFILEEMNAEQNYLYFYVEYESLDDSVALYYANRKGDKKGTLPLNTFYIDKDRYYIAYQAVLGKDNNNIEREAAWIFNGSEYNTLHGGAVVPDVFSSCGQFALYDYIKAGAPAEYKEIENYPQVLNKFGTVSKVNAYVLPNEELADDCGYENVSYTYIAEYADFKDEVTSKYTAMEDIYYPEDHSGYYNPDKKYIEYREQYSNNNLVGIICNFYSPDVSIVRGTANWKPEKYENFYEFFMGNPKYKYIALESNSYPESLDKFGNLDKIYVMVDSENKIFKEDSYDRYIMTYYAVYNNFNDVATDYHASKKQSDESYIEIDKSIWDTQKKYVVYEQFWNNDDTHSGDILYFFDAAESSYNTMHKTSKYSRWGSTFEKTIFDEIEFSSKTSYKFLQPDEYPEELKSLGTLKHVYALFHKDTGIVKKDLYWDDTSYEIEYIAAYENFSDDLNLFYNEKSCFGRGFWVEYSESTGSDLYIKIVYRCNKSNNERSSAYYIIADMDKMTNASINISITDKTILEYLAYYAQTKLTEINLPSEYAVFLSLCKNNSAKVYSLCNRDNPTQLAEGNKSEFYLECESFDDTLQTYFNNNHQEIGFELVPSNIVQKGKYYLICTLQNDGNKVFLRLYKYNEDSFDYMQTLGSWAITNELLEKVKKSING